jgi:hypothetical protein
MEPREYIYPAPHEDGRTWWVVSWDCYAHPEGATIVLAHDESSAEQVARGLVSSSDLLNAEVQPLSHGMWL